MTDFLVLLMFGCLLASAFSVGALLIGWLLNEEALPPWKRLVITLVPFLLFIPSNHSEHRRDEAKRRILFSIGFACLAFTSFVVLYLNRAV